MAKKPAKTDGLKNKNVVMANTLTRSAQRLSLAEKRMLFAAIAKMGGKFGEVNITASEYAETFDMPPNQAYEQLKETAKNFLQRYFTLVEPDEDGKGQMVWHIGWTAKVGYHDREGFVAIKFSDEIVPYLCELTDKFTKYKLKQACALRSVYSWRLLELFEQFKSTGELMISVEKFCHAMEAAELYRNNFAHLRKKIIEPAIKELQEKDDWLIEFDFTKRGRKVDQLKFKFEKNPQRQLQFGKL
jgi:plasmid replication initiation protein